MRKMIGGRSKGAGKAKGILGGLVGPFGRVVIKEIIKRDAMSDTSLKIKGMSIWNFGRCRYKG